MFECVFTYMCVHVSTCVHGLEAAFTAPLYDSLRSVQKTGIPPPEGCPSLCVLGWGPSRAVPSCRPLWPLAPFQVG